MQLLKVIIVFLKSDLNNNERIVVHQLESVQKIDAKTREILNTYSLKAVKI